MTLPSRWLIYGVLLTACSGCCETVFCQHFNTQKFTANDGLADSYALRIQQDSKGFLWVGTYNGLSRFDGKEFVNYGYAAGLPNLTIDVIYEDHEGRIWLGTRKGMVEFKGRSCVTYPLNDRLAISYVYDIREFSGLWALTDKGAYRLDSGTWKKQQLYPGLENHDCRSMIEMGKELYVNYGTLLAHRDSNGVWKELGKVYPSLHYDNLVAYQKKLYLSVQDELLLLKGGEMGSPSFSRLLYHKNMLGYFYDRRDRLWMSTADKGLLVASKTNTETFSDTIPIAFNLLSSLCEDQQGNMWAACFDGLMKIREVNYSVFDNQHNSLLSNTRNILVADSNVVACTQAGLVQYQHGRFEKEPFVRMPPSAIETKDDPVDFSTQDGRNRTWLVTRKKKIYLLEGHRIKDLTNLIRVRGDLCWGVAFNAFDRKVYVCSDSLLYGDEREMRVFRDVDGGIVSKPRTLHSFADGSLLIFTAANNFLRVDSGKRVRDITTKMGIEGSCTSVFVCAESSGKFWIAYNGGLIRYHWDGQGDPVLESRLTVRDGLPNDAVYAVTMDHEGRLWAITSAGLAVVEGNKGLCNKPVIHRLSEEMGISYNQWIQTRLLTAPDGAVWMCFLNSVFRFDPGAMVFDHEPPVTVLEDIQLNLRPTQWKGRTDSLYGYQQLPRQAVLPYQQNTLSISYKAACFSGVSGIEYSYRLEGIDSGWSVPFRNSSVSFVKLPPGSYRFLVRARKSDTDWGVPASFSFHIESPWWQRWWVRLPGMVMLVALVAMVFLLRIRQIRRKASIREQLQELELKALRSQMNPHFIFNALNSIQALVVDKKPQEASLYIGKFGRLLRKVLDHSEQNVITLEEELQALELYIQLERLRLNVSLQYRIIVDPAIVLDEEWLPPLILQPFAENALWHGLSRKTGERKLNILVDLKEEWIVVKIIDNGIGRRQAAAVRTAVGRETVSKGMDITSRRIKEYNRGPKPALVDITDLFDTEGQPSGTMVTLHIRRK